MSGAAPRHVALGIALIACGMGVERSANAQAPARDPAAAEAAFVEARALIRDGRVAEACPKLETSLALDPAVGTLLNLGDCLERVGRTASAWLRFREAAAMAVQQDQREREDIARERAAALEPRLCRLVVRTVDRPGLGVSRDGQPVPRAALGIPVPVDPGTHVVRAEAPGAKPFATSVDVVGPKEGTACALSVVEIPARLDMENPEAAASATRGPSEGRPSDAKATGGWKTSHTLAVVSGAAGLVSLGIGSAFALSAAKTKSDADAQCPPAGCTPEGSTLLTDAGRQADAATITIGIGALLLVTGTVLWFASPSLRASAASSRPLYAGIPF